MILKVFCGLVAVVLMAAYLAPPVWKLKDPALAAVALAGLVLMALDLWQSLRSKDD